MDPKRVKSYNQIKMCMCMKYGGYIFGGWPNSTMLLENISIFWNLENNFVWKHGLSYSSLSFSFQAGIYNTSGVKHALSISNSAHEHHCAFIITWNIKEISVSNIWNMTSKHKCCICLFKYNYAMSVLD
jgi:hypothetical protein